MSEPTSDQAPQQSLEDRIAAKFGYEPEVEQQHENNDGRPIEAEQEEETVEEVQAEADEAEVEYEGERYRVPKKLEKAILQERDYTKGKQELADQRRQLEHANQTIEISRKEQEFMRSVETEVQQIQQLDLYLKQMQNVDIRSLATDDKLDHLVTMQSVERQLASVKSALDEKRGKFDKGAKADIEALRKQAKELLAKQIPGYGDQTVAEIATHAKTLGYTEQDVEMMQIDPRAMTVLNKARLYDQLQANKAQAVQKATSPAIKPGSSNPMSQQTKDKLSYHKAMKQATNSQQKAKLIQQRLENMF
jgi:hypothetical protein